MGGLRVWLRESVSILGPRRAIVTVALSAVAAGLAVWWSLGDLNVALQALAGVVITVVLFAFFAWVVSGWLVPDAVLVTGDGPPFDDPAVGAADGLAFAKKIRVRVMTNEPLQECRVTLTDAPGGAVALCWLPDGGNELSLAPGDEQHYVVLPTALFPAGDHDVHLELTHARASEPVRWSAHLTVRPATFPTVVLER